MLPWHRGNGMGNRSRRCTFLAALTALLLAIAPRAVCGGTVLADSFPIRGSGTMIASGAVDRFDRSSIYEYLDGGADMYLDGGFTACIVRRYDLVGTVKGSLTITAYDMKTPLRAQGLFQTLAEGYTISKAGNVETMADVRREAFRAGAWLVEVVDKSDKELPAETLTRIAADLGSAMSGSSTGAPAEYSRLPHQGKVAGSERILP